MEIFTNQDDESGLINELSQSLSGSFLTSGYKSVNALLLYWQENDLGVETEVSMLQRFLAADYKFDTTTFAIPSERPEQALRKAISDFIFDRALPGTLAVIYYGGHGDPDEVSRKSIWAAKGAGPPTLDWFRIQPSLVEDADSDVLIILDCCYAAQAARGRGLHKVELLAASGMGCRTPGVGKFSFTRALMDQMKLISQLTNGSFTISQLHARMGKAEAGLQTTPVLFNLSGSGESIIIPSTPAAKRPHREGEAYYSFTVTVTDRPTRFQVAQISHWLKTAAPSSISNITIDKILLKSQQIRQITEARIGSRSRQTFMERMPTAIQNEVAQKLASLDQLIRDVGVLTNVPNSSSEAKIFLDRLEKLTNDGLEVLGEGALAMSRGDLKEFEKDDLAQNMGLSDGVNMLLLNMGEKQLSPPKLPGNIELASPSPAGTRFASGFISSDAIIVEYIYYQEDPLGGPSKGVTSQLEKLSVLLSRGDPSRFHILPCIGCFHDPEFSRYGLVFHQGTFRDLAFLSTHYDKNPRVALEHRFALAYALTEAIMHFHLVGWLHEGLGSENIALFGDEYAFPRIFGFDYSRTETDPSRMSADFVLDRNIYRHPDRWGVPRQEFSKVHDLFSLGVLLLEIGFWRLAKTMDKYRFSRVKKPAEVRDCLVKLARTRLPYQMGELYSAATLACLTGDVFDRIPSTPIDENRWEWQNVFKEKVLARLAVPKALFRSVS